VEGGTYLRLFLKEHFDEIFYDNGIIWAQVCHVTMSLLILYSIQVVGYAISMYMVCSINYVFIPCRPQFRPRPSPSPAVTQGIGLAPAF
jgi:hypothetical protein